MGALIPNWRIAVVAVGLFLGAGTAPADEEKVPLDKLPLQPSEKRARGLYKTLIDQAGDLPIATDARFELAELFAQRSEHDAAMQLLTDVLDKEPGPELTEKVRLQIGGVQAAKGNLKGALQQFDAVHFGHLQVRNYARRPMLPNECDGLSRVRGGHRLMPRAGQGQR